MMRIFILLFTFLIGGVALAQGLVIELKPNVRDESTNKGLGGVTIEVYKAGKLFKSESSNSGGKVNSIELPACIGCTYTVKIKKGGYVTKTAIVDGHSDYPEELPPGTFVQKFDVSIFESMEGIDFSFLEREPMIEFRLDSYGSLDYDRKKVEVMLKKIEDLKKRMEEKKEELEKENAEKEKQEADFNAYVKAGDLAVSKSEFEKAIGQYELALAIKDDGPVKSKLENAKIKLEELRSLEALNQQFADKMAAAKAAYTSDKLKEALKLYQEASSIKPNEQLPKDLITEIQQKIAENEKNNKAFSDLVAAGDAAISAKDLAGGIAKYEQALQLKKDDGVQKKLDAAKALKVKQDELLAEEKAKQLEFDRLIEKADAAFNAKDYEAAKISYLEAQKIKADPKPTNRLKEIDEILKKQQAELAAQEKLEADYSKLIKEGKELQDAREWLKAKEKYTAALALKNNDSFSLGQIDLINAEILKEKEQDKLNTEFNELMAAAQVLFEQKKYTESKSKYMEASGLKPGDELSKDKIREIETILSDLKKEAETEKEFLALIASGKVALSSKEYATAQEKFEKALTLKPGDADAKAKLAEIAALIDAENQLAKEEAEFNDLVKKGDASKASKNYENAKLNYQKALEVKEDAGVKSKLDEIDALIAANQNEQEAKEKYANLIKEADAFDKAVEYKKAIEKYEEALLVKEDAYPKGKIAELKIKLKEQEQKQKEEEEFNAFVKNAEEFLQAKEYNKALSKYKEAYAVRPDPAVKKEMDKLNVLIAEQNQNAEKKELYNEKIAEADQAFKDKSWDLAIDLYEDALNILSDQDYPKNQIDLIKIEKGKEAGEASKLAYQKLIDRADLLLEQEKLDEAIEVYKSAIALNNEDAYPKNKIEEINNIKRERENEASEKKKNDEKYTALINDADALFNASSWADALTKYKEALQVKPGEVHPTTRVKEIESKMDAAGLQKKNDEKYEAVIKVADELFNAENYSQAKAKYIEALSVKPNEQYPKDKITSADNFMKAGTENEEEEAYQKILRVAQEKFDAKDYTKALDLYLRAQKTKPSDLIPQQRIDEINQILAKEAAAEKDRKAFEELKKEGDYQFEKGNWKAAKESYIKAQALIDETYVANQIKRCDENMKAISLKEVDKNYNKIISTADKYFNQKNYEKAKGLYERANGIKPSDQYPIDKIAEINALLNPSKNNNPVALTNYGKANRSTNAVDVEGMLADAEAQRKEITRQKTEQQGIDASNAELEFKEVHVDATFETRGDVLTLNEERIVFGENAEEEIVLSGLSVEAMQLTYEEFGKEALKGNENVVQQQNQVVNNINIEMDESELENDLPREEFESDVDAIKAEIILENQFEDNAQTNDVFNQVDYVQELDETRLERNEEYDVDRKNTEIHVEDLGVLLVNETNISTWDQENIIMDTDIVTEESEIDRENKDRLMDVPRLETEVVAEEVTAELIVQENRLNDNQYDVSIAQKKQAEHISDDIIHENLTNDIPRQNMEVFSADQKVEYNEVIGELTLDQNNVLFNSDNEIDASKVGREKDAFEDDKNREGYEEVVQKIKEDDNDYLEGKDASSENNSHSSAEYVAYLNKESRELKEVANINADAVIDDTKSSVEKMEEDQKEVGDKSIVDLENSEDFVESLRDIKVDQIDEKMKNQLGSQFPEGVTEEIFTLNDENGLMTSYVIRRIVVREGEGNVYEMVTTKFGTSSYTCNGAAISEYQWQDQTNSSDLVRN